LKERERERERERVRVEGKGRESGPAVIYHFEGSKGGSFPLDELVKPTPCLLTIFR
jgi:hypothetical protein